jgi:hypothetical protein
MNPTPTTVDAHKRSFLRGCALCAAGAGLFSPLLVDAREGVEVGKESAFAKLVPAEEIEASARQQYQQMLKQAADKKALGPDNHPEVLRLRAIAQRIIPHSYEWNPRAREWKWEVNLIGSNQVNAFCMPGGKIAFYYGILKKLNLSDDEVAMVMGHEVAHALREHARERMGKSTATQGLTRIGGALSFLPPERVFRNWREGIRVPASAASDIYQLGVMFYWILTNMMPFRAPTSTALVHAITTHVPDQLRNDGMSPRTPPHLKLFVDRALSKNPDERPQSLRKCL